MVRACWMCTLISFGTISFVQAQLPSVPGFDVEVYATVGEPIRISFDPQTGAMFAGRDLANPRAAARIHRVSAGGSSVSEYGNSPIADPDVPLFDATGSISGVAGSVLVGGLNAAPPDRGSIWTIAPDETVSLRFGPSASYLNPTDMAFDSTGRFLFVDAGIDASSPLSVWASSGADPLPLITFAVGERPVAIAIDPQDRIFTSAIGRDTIQIHDASGALLDAAFATGLPEALLAFGPGGAFGSELHAVANGELVRIDAAGAQTTIGTGFGSASGIAFGPDGALYVAERNSNRVLRIIATSSVPGAVPTPTLRIRKTAASELELSWAPSCSAGTTDYAIYEGTLGNWYNHAPAVCTDAGADLVEIIPLPAEDTYYLVVPQANADEGSYGMDSSGLQRPIATGACQVFQTTGCP